MGKCKLELYKLAQEHYEKTGESLTKVSKLFGIDRGNFTCFLKKQGIQIINKQNSTTIIENYFEIIDTEEKAYWLGFFFADGNVSKNSNNLEVSLKASDKEHLEKLAKSINYTNNIAIDDVRCRLCFANKKMKLDLINKGCIPNKSLILEPPKNIPDELIIHFIRGYFDGDGCIAFNEGKHHRPTISVLGTRKMLNFISMYLTGSFKILKCNKGSNDTLVLTYTGEEARRLTFKLYENSTIYLNRKFQRFQLLKIALQDGNILNALSKYGRIPRMENPVVNNQITKG